MIIITLRGSTGLSRSDEASPDKDDSHELLVFIFVVQSIASPPPAPAPAPDEAKTVGFHTEQLPIGECCKLESRSKRKSACQKHKKEQKQKRDKTERQPSFAYLALYTILYYTSYTSSYNTIHHHSV